MVVGGVVGGMVGYLIFIGAITAFYFTRIPEWTTWLLLVMMALYDLAAVLTPVGPLRVLVELAQERQEDIPALVYEARPVRRNPVPAPSQTGPASLMSTMLVPVFPMMSATMAGPSYTPPVPDSDVAAFMPEEPSVQPTETHGPVPDAADNTSVPSEDFEEPLINSRNILMEDVSASRSDVPHSGAAPVQSEQRQQRQRPPQTDNDNDGYGLPDAIKLGLGDFIFYSVMVGRAAMYDMMTVFGCYLAIVAGLGATLLLLAVFRKALPALPISIALGVMFYFLVRIVLEPMVVGMSTNLVMY